MNHKIWDFDFWNKDAIFKEQKPERQTSLTEIKYGERLRKIKRDYKVINQAQQWEQRLFLKILDNALQTI